MGVETDRRKRWRKRLLLIALLLACALYVWQVAVSWVNQAGVTLPWVKAKTPRPISATSYRTVQLRGTGIAAGATGALAFDSRGASGTLQAWDLPVLPPGQIYQVWCADTLGNVDSPGYFGAFADIGEPNTVIVATDRMISVYARFFITIEPAGGSVLPAGQVVMQNE